MGRGKIEIKRIENSSNRQVTYSKRRNGIIKKAKEITVLCDAKVSLIILGSSGKMYEFISPGTTMIDILDVYQKATGKKLWDAKHEHLSNEIDRIKKENDSMQIELRHLNGEDIQSLSHKELMLLEHSLEKGIACIKDKQSEFVKMARKREEMLEDENKQLLYELHRREAVAAANCGGDVYHHQQQQQRVVSDYQTHQMMPFTFRVQPMQPNLHGSIN
ncbi:hypothetical protein Leryth_008347 [Lithospermum erythrorhizon]|uniref:Uncharacterized protein n=1 Tax=Lithospermum erythrorhizon TaxID=34254 RepID=A0AAV3RR15_LITER|nr:hypothetical protein Leryth_008347 [Lithospermum erythrorhizon]